MAKRFKHKRAAKPEADRDVFALLRLMRGQKTADIARAAGVLPSCVSKLRTRRTRYPRFSTVRALAKACGWHYLLVPRELPARARPEERATLH